MEPININNLSLDELYLLKVSINDRICQLEKEKKLEAFGEKVSQQGFEISPNYQQNGFDLKVDLPGLNVIHLPYRVLVYAKNGDLTKIRVNRKPIQQEDWVKYLNVSYKPVDEDKLELITEWYYEDEDNIPEAVAIIKIPVYYRPLKVLPDKFVVISEDGHVGEGYIDHDGQTYLDGNKIYSLDPERYFILPL